MTMEEILSSVDDHGFEDTLEARKVQVVNAVIRDICAREPWTFLEEDASVTINAREITKPTDFRAVLSLVIPSLGLVLVPERGDTVHKSDPASLTATGDYPTTYYFVGNTLYVRPVPTTSLTGTMFFLRNHPVVTADSVEADILIPAAHHQVIVDGTVSRIAAMEDDPDNAGLFKGFYEEGIQMMHSTWKRQYDLPDRVIDVFENGEGW